MGGGFGGARGAGGFGGGGGRVVVGGGAGVILLVIVIALMGGDPGALLNSLPIDGGAGAASGADSRSGAATSSAAEEQLKAFVSVVLADTEDVWNGLFRDMGRTYREPRLVLFSGGVQSGCGTADAAVGPFYCPADEQVYIDLSFYDELQRRFGAPGDFAQAYVIAHEVGHHVQKLLGTSDKVAALQARASQAEGNALSVRLELQADYLAGVFAHHARQYLEAGDVEEALTAATAIGDDQLQRQAQGYVVPDSFTHGTSAQRAGWFRRGLEAGDLSQGDTFSAKEL